MPLDSTSGLAQSGQLSLNGTGAKSTNGAWDGTNIGKEFLNVGSTDAVAMGSLYKASTGSSTSGGPVTDSDQNTIQGIPTSGEISMSDFYKTSNAIDPLDESQETITAKSNLSTSNGNGGWAYARGGSDVSSSSYVQYNTSMDTCFALSKYSYGNSFQTNDGGFDMIIKPVQSSGKTQHPNLTGYDLVWYVRPYGASASFVNSGGTISTVTTSTWQEIWRLSWDTPIESSTEGATQSFKYAPSQFGWRYASYDVLNPTNSWSGHTWTNAGWFTSTGTTTNYHMEPLAHNSGTVYTFGDGDGPYSTTAGSSWIDTAQGNNRSPNSRGSRLAMTQTTECVTATARTRFAMNAILTDPSSSTDGSSYANTSLNSAGMHSYVSPTFVFDVTLYNVHSGTCDPNP